jgi:hypothetical protein
MMQIGAIHRTMSRPLDHERISQRRLDFKNKTGSMGSLDSRMLRDGDIHTAHEFTVSSQRQLMNEVMSVEILRDVVALCALVLFGTMLALLLGGAGVVV